MGKKFGRVRVCEIKAVESVYKFEYLGEKFWK
jgi:hypothetical protein